jgi:hypothetical protein
MKLHNPLWVLIVSFTAAALNWSCQVVALGPKLDLEAPRLSITRPVFAEVVLEKFELAGTVTDNIKPTLLTVNIEKVSREWKNDQGIWQTRETPESPWQPYAGTWNVNGTGADWSLSISLAGMSPGDYEIAVNSFDEFNNNDAHSAQRIKITYHNENPFFTVLDPVLKIGTDNRVPPVLEDMDDQSRRNPALIGELYNESVSMNYEIGGGDFTRGGTLIIYLAGPSPSETDPIAGTIWYEKTIPISNRIGSITISHAEIKNSADGQPALGRTPLQIISRITDSLMKEEYKSSGWFMWWPESDKPWVVFSAGSDPAADPYTKLYEGGENTIYAYDDDGTASLRYRIYRWNRKSQQTEGNPVAEETVSFADNQSEWLFTVPSTPGDYRIEAAATDTHGTSGDTGYAYITAIKRPSVAYKFLTRISSSNTDGNYKAGDRIDILLDFDVPIFVDGNPGLKLNIEAGNSGDRYAKYISGSRSKTLYFTYTMQDGDHTPGTNPLDVTAIDTSSGDFSFVDTYGDRVNINSEIKIPDTAYRLAQQKEIYVLHGKPVVTSTVMVEGVLTVQFEWPENPFSWSMVKGNGNLMMEIEENDYRIPSVIPKARYEELGIGGYTDASGKPYYELTINGAFYDGRTDTDPKYVLRFDLNTAGFGGSAAGQKDRNLRNAIRDKEKISLSAYSSQVTVSSHTLTVNVSAFQPLKGVKYNLFISKGFLTDSIVQIDSDEVRTQVLRPGVEKPFFRIEKKDEEISGTGEDMQARQPVTAQVKLDCRTPGAEIFYTDPANAASFTVDPVENYLLEQRKESDNNYYLIPRPQPAEIDVPNSMVRIKPPVWREHPHPDKLPNPHTPVKPPSSDPESRTETYNGTPFKIGSENYALGGMAYRLTAVAYPAVSGNTPSELSYEVAYRSVLVFNNTEPPPGGDYTTRVDGGNSGIFKFPSPYKDGKQVRVWLIGGDSAAGSVLTPGFPLSWNAGEYDKVRLMTPIGKKGVTGGGSSQYSAVGDHINNTSGVVETTLTYRNIASPYDTSGTYTWYWITWKLGNAAYVQFQRRVVKGSGPQNPPFETSDKFISNLKQGWNNYKDYYPVFPGETRVVNPTTPYWYRESGKYNYYKLLGKRDSSTRWHPLSQS